MTSLDTILEIAAGAAWMFHLGWLAGSRWRRAHDAARYAQIEARRHHAGALRALREREAFRLIETTAVEGAVILRSPDPRMPWEGGEPYLYLVNPAFLADARRQAESMGGQDR